MALSSIREFITCCFSAMFKNKPLVLKSVIKQKLLHVYDTQYKKLTILSVLLLLVCIGILVANYARTGELFQKGVSLKGGITMTIPLDSPLDTNNFEKELSAKFPNADIAVREVTEAGVPKALILEAADVSREDLLNAVPELGIPLIEGRYSSETMGSSLGLQFFAQTTKAVILAFILMSLVVFITFRSIVPSAFVVLAAFSDIVSTLAVVDILGIKMSTAGIAALLMLIGYSVDTDILLTTKVLKRKSEGGTTFERILGALKTGIVMTSTALVAAIVGLIFAQSDTIKQIMLIVTIGLIFDLIYTWFQNAGILRWYLESKEKEISPKVS